MRQFFDAHWGDLLALYLLHMGLILVILFHSNPDVSHVGEGLMATGLVTLRFKGREIRP